MRIIVVGAGGHGRSVAESILLAGQHELVGFLDDALVGAQVMGHPVLGCASSEGMMQSRLLADAVVIAIGNNRVRESLFSVAEEVGYALPVIAHPAAIISPSASIAAGVVIMSGAIVGTEASLQHGVIVNSGCVVDHHCVLGSFAHLGVGVNLAGGVNVGERAWLQAGCSAGYGVIVAAGSNYQAGCVLHKPEA